MAKSTKTPPAKETAAPAKEAPLAETPKATKEVLVAKEDIKNITTGFDKLAVKKKEVEALVKKAETIVATFDKESKESVEALSSIVSELRKTRTSIESARTAGSAPFRALIDKWNADNMSIIGIIKDAEAKVKPIKEDIDAAEQKRKDEKKLADQQLLMGRIGLLTELGFKQIDGFYILRDDLGESVVELQAVEISSMSDVNWEKVQKLAKEFNDEKELQAEKDRQAKKEADEKIAKEKEENRLEAQRIANERFENRKDRLDMMGFTFTDTHVNHPTKITESIDYIKAMDNEKWNVFIANMKQKIEDAQVKAKRDSLLDQIRMNGFSVMGNNASFTDGTFKHIVSLETINDVQGWEAEYGNFTKLHNEYKVQKEATDKKNNERLDKLAAEGLVFVNHFNHYVLKPTTPGAADFEVQKQHALDKSEDEFVKLINYIKDFKAKDAEAKKLYDKNEADRIARENAEMQGDAKNIAQFKKDIQAAKSKFILKKANAEVLLSNKVNAFLDSL